MHYHSLCQTAILLIKKAMAMSKDEMEKEHDYQMREKVALEEEASWLKLCSKLVSVYIKIVKKIVKKS